MMAAPSNGVTQLAQPRWVRGPLFRCAKCLSVWVVAGSHVRAGKGSSRLHLEASSLFFTGALSAFFHPVSQRLVRHLR